MTLSITTDSGRSWKTVYRNPRATSTGQPQQGPFLMPMTFINAEQGFAASGVPPADPVATQGGFFTTSDGGSTWTQLSPPKSSTPAGCPPVVGARTTTTCLYTLPVFNDLRTGTLAAVATSGHRARVAFDVTSDGGHRWQRASQVSLPVTSNQSGLGYPLMSVSAGSWWALGATVTTATADVTTTDSAHWTTLQGSFPIGRPISLNAISPTHALLTLQHETPSGTTIQLLFTTDAGRYWAPLGLP